MTPNFLKPATGAALLAALFFLGLSLLAPAALAAPGRVGDKPPSMVLADPQGAKHDITLSASQEKGPICIYFWSVFCINCKEAMPLLFELNERWKEKGLTIWAVNVDGDRFTNAVEAFLAEAELPFPVVYDKLDGELLIAADPLDVNKTPTLILLNARGEVALRQEVIINLPEVEKTLTEMGP